VGAALYQLAEDPYFLKKQMAVYDNLYVSPHRTKDLILCFFTFLFVISFDRLFSGHDPKAGEGPGRCGQYE
jgi:hypothetical protein